MIIHRETDEALALLRRVLILPVETAEFLSSRRRVERHIMKDSKNIMFSHEINQSSAGLQILRLDIIHVGVVICIVGDEGLLDVTGLGQRTKLLIIIVPAVPGKIYSGPFLFPG